MHLKSSVTIESIGKVDVSTIEPFGQGFYETCLFWNGGSNVVETTGNSQAQARAIAKAISDYTKIMED